VAGRARTLEAVQAHIAAHVGDLKAQQGSGENPEAKSPVETWLRADHGGPYDRYRINVVVDNQGLTGAPVIEETNPAYMHLIGHVDMRAEFARW